MSNGVEPDGILHAALALDETMDGAHERAYRRQGAQDASGTREACERLAAVCRGLGVDAIVGRLEGRGAARVVVLGTGREREVA